MNGSLTAAIPVLLALAVFTPASAAESDDGGISVIGGVAYLHKSSDFTIGGTPYKPEFISIEWSAILAYDRFYIQFSLDQSIKDSFEVNNSLNTNRTPPEFNHEILMSEREDRAITFGYSLLDNLSVFIGHKSGITSGISGWQVEHFTQAPDPNFIALYSEFSVEESGPFIGIGYTYQTQRHGSLLLSVAYADLDGTIDSRRTELDNLGDKVFLHEILNGTSSGFSYKISWTDVFSADMTYSINLNLVRYEFDAPLSASGDNLDFDNNFSNVSIAFNKFF